MIQDQPKPEWAPLARPGAKGVECRILLGTDGIFIANLRFSQSSTIDQHSAPHEIDVICASGSGFTSVGGNEYAIHFGQSIRWPANIDHCLWTEDDRMETIMVERYVA